jgi:hypothetical protein
VEFLIYDPQSSSKRRKTTATLFKVSWQAHFWEMRTFGADRTITSSGLAQSADEKQCGRGGFILRFARSERSVERSQRTRFMEM